MSKYLHKNRILHLNIKQENLLVIDFMEFKPIDYSIRIDYKIKGYYTSISKNFWIYVL